MKGCLVWRDAPIGKELAVAPQPTPGTSCISMSFHRFSHAEARRLLTRRRLLLLGDSVMSYWYLSLAHFLHSGDTLKTWNVSYRGHELPLYELLWSQVGRAWRSAQWWAWNAYYQGTNGDFGEYEICDCYREPCFTKCAPSSYVGVRHLRLGRDGTTAGLISLMPWLGTFHRPRWNTLDEVGWTLRCDSYMEQANKRRCAPKSLPAHDLANASSVVDALEAVAVELKPDVMLNGLVSNWPDRGLGSEVCHFASRYKHARPTDDRTLRVWVELKTGDWNFVSPAKRRLINATGQCSGSARTDYRLPVSALVTRLMLATKKRAWVFVDNVHFHPWVYHELSQLLLNVLARAGVAPLRPRQTN